MASGHDGMSLRAYFAGQAMARWLPADLLSQGCRSDGWTRHGQLDTIVKNSLAVADALIAELQKTP